MNHKFPSPPVVISVGLPTLDVGMGNSAIGPAPRATRESRSRHDAAAIKRMQIVIRLVTGNRLINDE
jgi:hypothetical protein